MPKNREIWGLLCATALVLPVGAQAGDAFTDAVTGGKVSGNFRLRYEEVTVDSLTVEDAEALTLRSRLGYETAPFHGFTALVEFEDVHSVGGGNNYAPEEGAPYTHAAIVDPENTEINRAYVRYRGVPKLDLGLGRQRIILDNQRFVGAVAWRQDEQTFDAFTASYAGVPDFTFYYAYVDSVNGIASESPTYNFDMDSSDSLFNITYSGFVLGKLTAYGYFLNNREPEAVLRNVPATNVLNPALRFKSNDTYGLRFDGSYVMPITMPLRLFYTAEYAKQELTNPAEVEFDTDYSLVEVGLGYTTKVGVVSAKFAQEVLGSDQVQTTPTTLAYQGFQTPYASKHIFNGWVDMFLNTPPGGLKDQYATLAADLQPYGVKLMAMYHTYSEEDGPVTGGGARDFGTEWNLQALKQFGSNYTVGVKYGDYKADDDIATIGASPNIDTKKFWVWGEFTF